MAADDPGGSRLPCPCSAQRARVARMRVVSALAVAGLVAMAVLGVGGAPVQARPAASSVSLPHGHGGPAAERIMLIVVAVVALGAFAVLQVTARPRRRRWSAVADWRTWPPGYDPWADAGDRVAGRHEGSAYRPGYGFLPGHGLAASPARSAFLARPRSLVVPEPPQEQGPPVAGRLGMRDPARLGGRSNRAERRVVTLGWPELAELDAYRITEIPRPDAGDAETPRDHPADPGRTQRLAALIAAYHAGVGVKSNGHPALALGWVRHGAGGPVQFLAAGPGLVGSQGDSEVLLTLPGGARARPLPRGALAALMSRLPCWRAIGGISDGLRPEAEPRTGERPLGAPATLEECLLAVWPGAFGWLLVAEPAGAAEIGEIADQVARREEQAASQAERFSDRAVEARRLRLRHAELRQGASTGLWRIRLAAGGADADAATRVAGLVCASVDLTGLPYAVAPADGDVRGLPELMQDAGPASAGGDAALSYPCYASTELVAALARPPEREVPGVRLALRPDFDVSPEPAALESAALESAAGRELITVGEVLDRSRRPAGPLALPHASLNRHVFVCGATGAGKSQTVRALLEAATRAGIGWLVVEPAKAEYRLMAARLGAAAEVVRIRPGESDAIAAGLNPLEPAPDAAGRRFPLQTHADLVKALFIASFRSEEPFPQVLSAALTRVYEDAGWDLALGETTAADPNPSYPSLTALQRAAIRIVREVGYSQRITDDVLGFIKVRLSSLRLGTTGRFLEGGHQLDFGKLLRTNAVLEIEDVGDDSDKAFLMGTVLIRLAEHLRMEHKAEPAGEVRLRHLTVIEEAHRLLRRPDAAGGGPAGGAAAHAVEMFAGLLAEIRAYGEGLIIAEQIPGRLVQDVIKNKLP